MDTTVTLDDQHFKVATEKARELGTTPERYICSLIDAATLTFDEILAPVREEFRKSGVTEEELDDAVTEARNAIRRQARRSSGK
ncbi:MAG: hypothetical protein JWO87_3758 [Phycisphaerales bacterium]|jgi:hypothetical protein|nr:hypothetical protein [Phycisphaerales bacterium]